MLSGNEQYEGFCVELIAEISKLNDNFTVNLIIDPEGKSGKKESDNPPRWNGMIGYIQRGVPRISINIQKSKITFLKTAFDVF